MLLFDIPAPFRALMTLRAMTALDEVAPVADLFCVTVETRISASFGV